ncbi:uncharacterized protein [Cicer arietinum]|uniref:uncharacterized protein isoform X2 n=1 Tax=Cicer arietinum TaxID=3827 RepID=UPI003CC61F7F
MIDQFINFVIRPPRAEYNPDQYLWEKEFTLAGKNFQRKDLELKNTRGYTLQCSHYLPSPLPANIPLPCVIYCHGNSGCRADANEAAVILLPSNITVFTLDFSGSGLSDGDHVSLGWHEKDDLKMVVSYLRSDKQVSRIGLWGRSMGAVTSLLYGAEDPSIAGMVLDSAFSNLYDLMIELVDVYKIRLPKFTVKMIVQYMRRVIEKKAKFDIKNLNCLQAAPKTFIPVLFGHANDDLFVQPHHSDLISESYAGLLYDILSSIQSSTNDAASSSSAPPTVSKSTIASESVIREDKAHGYGKPCLDEPADAKDEQNGPAEDFFSYSGSTRESWGKCPSLGLTDEESYPDFRGDDSDSEVFATPLGSLREILEELKEDEDNPKKEAEQVRKKLKPDRFEKLESLSRRLRRCILKGSAHRRHQPS